MAIVGLGKVSAHHMQALSALDDVDVIGAVDTDRSKTLTFRGAAVPVFRSVSELLALVPSALIVATPTPTHHAVCREILDRAPSLQLLLVEKPLAVTLEDVDDLLLRATSQLEVVCLYHAADAPEVRWATAQLSSWTERFGPISGFEMSFSDPYRGADSAHRVATYCNSWLDSGINALSIALRFVRLIGVRSLRRVHPAGSVFECQLSISSGGTVGSGSIRTSWQADHPSKESTFVFDSGARLFLNHQDVSGKLVESSGTADAFRYNGSRPRLTAHYDAAFARILVDGSGYYRSADTALLHRLLLEPSASAG